MSAKKIPKGNGNISKRNTAEKVMGLVQPVADELGLELWDVRYEKEGALWYLKLIIDKEGGVTLKDCEDMSRRSEKLLDETDPIEENYRFQVSSPGIERELTRAWHFERCIGRDVRVRFIRPVAEMGGERDFAGMLSSFDNGEVGIILDGTGDDESDGTEMRFDISETAFVRLVDDFDYAAAQGELPEPEEK